jgi:hypothetical protein
MLQVVHHIITFTIVFGGIISGFLLQNTFLLMAHMFLCGNIIIHWLTNDNRCILSKNDYAEKNGYTAEVLKYIGVNIDPTDESIGNMFSYGITFTSLILSWRRLLALTRNRSESPSEPDSEQSVALDSAEPSQPQSP